MTDTPPTPDPIEDQDEIILPRDFNDPEAGFYDDNELDAAFSHLGQSSNVRNQDAQPDAPTPPVDEPQVEPTTEPTTETPTEPTEPTTPEPTPEPQEYPPSDPNGNPIPPTFIGEDEDVVIGTVRIPKSDKEALAALYHKINSDPVFAQSLSEFIRNQDAQSQVPQVPHQEPAQQSHAYVPDAVDLSDPTTKALWDRVTNAENEAKRAASIAAQQQQTYIQTEARRNTTMALDVFKSAHPHLSDADLKSLAAKAGQMGIVDPLVRNLGDPVAGITEALNMVYASDDDLRAKEATAADSRSKDKARQSKLSALTGSSGAPTSKTPAPTRTSSQRHTSADMDAMVAEIQLATQS